MKRFGKYLVYDRLNVGGMAEIYLAKNSDGRKYVIKSILPSYATKKKFVQMFIDEAKISLNLEHENIVKVFDFGITGDNELYLVMEYLEGKTLWDLISKLKRAKRVIPVDIVELIILDVVNALEYVFNKHDSYGNRLSIVHQDISLPNIVVTYDGGVKVLDFGIAKFFDAVNSGQDDSDIIKGKLNYMSPEQIEGGEIEQKSDIYSVGIVFYELLTLTKLFNFKSRAEAVKMQRKQAIPSIRKINPAVSERLEALVTRALSRNYRYNTITEFKNELLKSIDSITINIKEEKIKTLMANLWPKEAKSFLLEQLSKDDIMKIH